MSTQQAGQNSELLLDKNPVSSLRGESCWSKTALTHRWVIGESVQSTCHVGGGGGR